MTRMWRYPKANTDALLEYIDRGMSNIPDADLHRLAWRNDEVLALMADVRSLLTTGSVVPMPGEDAELVFEPDFPTPDREAVDALAESLEASRSTSDRHEGAAVFSPHGEVSCSVCGWVPRLPDLLEANAGLPVTEATWGQHRRVALIQSPHPYPKG